MNPIKELRLIAGLTQQQLAERAGTSQATIALYESGGKSPTLATLRKLSSAAGREVGVVFHPPLTREDARSLLYHEAVAGKLRRDPSAVLERARHNLERMKVQSPGTASLLRRWERWLRSPVDELIANMLDLGVRARDMRQVTPFAGVLTPGERTAAIRRFRRQRSE